MGEIIALNSAEGINNTGRKDTDISVLTEGILPDTENILQGGNALSVPLAELATLGTGVSSLLPALRTVTQTTTINTSGLYSLANEAVGDTLKMAKNGNFWGAYKTADGTSKFAQLQSAGPLTATSQTVAAINPATMMMAVALFSIEQQLGEIQEMQKQILSFLEIEKESEIEADVETLSDIVLKYKLNWDNDHFVASNHKMVLDIQRTARKNTLSYQKNIDEIVHNKKLIVAQAQVRATLDRLLKMFKYYQLSLYTFSMASLMEIMLSGNFKEEYVVGLKGEIEKMSDTYRKYFEDGSKYLEKMSNASVEANVLKGIGSAGKAVGKMIGRIPVVKDGPVDEFLQDGGAHMRKIASGMEENPVHSFAKLSSPKTRVLIDRMTDMVTIYNHTEKICFDDKKIYLISG